MCWKSKQFFMPLNSSSSVQFGDIVLEKKVTIAALASETQAEVASCVFIYYIAMLSTLAALLALFVAIESQETT